MGTDTSYTGETKASARCLMVDARLNNFQAILKDFINQCKA